MLGVIRCLHLVRKFHKIKYFLLNFKTFLSRIQIRIRIFKTGSKIRIRKKFYRIRNTAFIYFRYIYEELLKASSTPTWTNIAYHKYYSNAKQLAIR